MYGFTLDGENLLLIDLSETSTLFNSVNLKSREEPDLFWRLPTFLCEFGGVK